LILIALLLVACQAPAAVRGTPTAKAIGQRPAIIYVANAGEMVELDWAGKTVGSVSAQGFAGPSADGSRFLRYGNHLMVEDSSGHALGQLAEDPAAYGVALWADDGRHVCGIVLASNAGPDSGEGSLWIGAPGEPGRKFGPAGKPGSAPAVAACSLKNGRAVVVGGLFPHWPPQATRYLITTDVQVVNLATGAVEYEHKYPLGYLAGEGDPSARPNWVLDAVSPDARYVAESSVFDDSTTIRELPSGRVLAALRGRVVGFAGDGSRLVMNTGTPAEVQLLSWADQHVIWHHPGGAQSMLAKPGSDDVLINITNQGGATELFAITEVGTNVIASEATVSWPCPCLPGV